MKKIVLCLTALAIAFASCSNGSDSPLAFAALDASNPAATDGTGQGTTPSTGTDAPIATPSGTPGTDAAPATPGASDGPSTGGVTIDGDGTVTINSSKMVFIGDDTETIVGVEYKVKKYAQLVIDDNPYFYTYYKLYYLNNKLRRLYSFDHGIGCDMDYKYDEFVEHQCGDDETPRYPTIYEYHENGKIAAYTYQNYGRGKRTFYDNGKLESHIAYAADGVTETSKTLYTYYDNGKTKTLETYSAGKLSYKYTYYDNGKQESYISYAADGVTEASKELYTYYDNGNQKTYEIYSAGKLSIKCAYYESGNPQKAETYNSDGKLSQIYTFYDLKASSGVYVSGLTTLYGKQESGITYAADGVTETSKTLYTYYDNGNKKTEETYSAGKLSSKSTYYDNGKQESYISYAADGVTEESKSLYTYYDNGNLKTYEKYSAGKLSSKRTYYDNGNKKTEETYSVAGKKYYVYMYFNESSSRQKLYASFNGDTGKLSSFSCVYMSGYTRCYYSSGYFYTYADKKTTTSSIDPSVYSSKEAYTQEQAEAKLEELLNE